MLIFIFVLQLNMAKDSEKVLDGFLEGPLKFPPTYKFDVGTNTYDTRWEMSAAVYFGISIRGLGVRASALHMFKGSSKRLTTCWL